MVRNGKLVKCRPKFNPFTKSLMMNAAGFPDFIAFKAKGGGHQVIGVEVKISGLLSREEKEKCVWLLDKGIFSSVWIAKQGKKRGEIEYVDFKDKYGV